MAITGHFDADFGKFQAAVDGAVIKLKSFESGAGKVESSLERMANQFTGQRVISQATIMAAAVERVGGIAKITDAELARVGKSAVEATEKMKKLGMEVPESVKNITKAYEDLLARQEAARKPPAEPTGGFFGDLSGQIAKTAAGFLSAEAAMKAFSTAVGTAVDFVRGSVQSFLESEAASNKLVVALRAQSMAAPEVVTQYGELAAAFQSTTKFSDDLIAQMEALLVQVGDVMPSKMQDALTAATDLAEGLGIDLQTATMLVAKAAAGHTETLGKYGIAVSDAALKTKGFDAVLDAINDKFGGQAQAALDTTSGKLEKMANDWDNVKEAVGKALVGSPLTQRALKELGEAAGEAGDKADGAIGSISGLARAFGFPIEADILLGLEHYVDLLNNADSAIARILAKPSPFQQQAKPRELPAKAPGVDENMKQFERDSDIAIRSGKAYEKYLLEVTGSTDEYRKTLAQMNPELVDSIKWSLQAGAAQQTLADLHGISIGQIKAVAEALKEEKAAQEGLVATYQRRIELMQAGTNLANLGTQGQIDALRARDRAEYELTKAVYAQIESETTRMKLLEDYTRRHLALQQQIADKEKQLAAERANRAVAAEAEAGARVNAAQGLTAMGVPLDQANNPFEVLRQTLARLDAEMVEGISQENQRQEAMNKFLEQIGSFSNYSQVAAANLQTLGTAATTTATAMDKAAAGATQAGAVVSVFGKAPELPTSLVPKKGLIGGGASPFSLGSTFGAPGPIGSPTPGGRVGPSAVTINVSGVLDPRTINELAAAVGRVFMTGSGGQFPNR